MTTLEICLIAALLLVLVLALVAAWFLSVRSVELKSYRESWKVINDKYRLLSKVTHLHVMEHWGDHHPGGGLYVYAEGHAMSVPVHVLRMDIAEGDDPAYRTQVVMKIPETYRDEYRANLLPMAANAA